MEEKAKTLTSDDQLLRIDDVIALTTLSKSCINLWGSPRKIHKAVEPFPNRQGVAPKGRVQVD